MSSELEAAFIIIAAIIGYLVGKLIFRRTGQ